MMLTNFIQYQVKVIVSFQNNFIVILFWVESKSGGGFLSDVGSQFIVVLGIGIVGSSFDIRAIENLVSGEIVDLVLHTGIKTRNSTDEHLDDVIEDSVFFLTSVLFRFVFSSLNVKGIDGVV